ncbi:MAG: hypothetical protein QOE70_4392 [Chthoniobacter sp.]|jgi:outer membrane protein assembly factor BamE (lipoprotein component of BamABCDE complex)|nr:hypothetical protein [Chthoniobacter sp.]
MKRLLLLLAAVLAIALLPACSTTQEEIWQANTAGTKPTYTVGGWQGEGEKVDR